MRPWRRHTAVLLPCPLHLMPATALARLPSSGPTELVFCAAAWRRCPGPANDAARATAGEYPQAAVLYLNAPAVADGASGNGRQWFSEQGLSETNRAKRVASALPAFIATLRSVQKQFAMPWERTALAGFSQGATLALEAVQAESSLVGRVLVSSGRHVTAPSRAPDDATVHLFHGMADRVVPPGPAIDSAERLVALGGDVTADVLPGIGHELHPQLIEKAIEQLRTFLPKKLWRQAMSEAPVLPRVASSSELSSGKHGLDEKP